MKANEVLNRGKQEIAQEGYNPFAEDEQRPQMTPEQLAAKVSERDRERVALVVAQDSQRQASAMDYRLVLVLIRNPRKTAP